MAAKLKTRKFTATDGKLVLTLETCEEGGFSVTCPMEPALHTQGQTIQEAFEMAHDAWNLIKDYQKSLKPRKTRRAA